MHQNKRYVQGVLGWNTKGGTMTTDRTIKVDFWERNLLADLVTQEHKRVRGCIPFSDRVKPIEEKLKRLEILQKRILKS